MRLAIALTAAVAAATVLAQSPARKPGLWEVQSRQSGAGMPDMNEMLAQMPPAQRAQAEQMLKQQGAGAGAATSSFRYCLTPERAAKDTMPPTDPDTQCEHKVGSRSASEAKFSFSCKRKDGSRVEGEGRSYDLTPEGYATDMTMKMVRDGKPMQMRVEQRGRWVGADCKGLKPPSGG